MPNSAAEFRIWGQMTGADEGQPHAPSWLQLSDGLQGRE